MADREVRLVTTINGEVLPKSKCRFIRKKYYKTGKVNVYNSGDCFRVTDSKGITKYRTLETGAVVWDEVNKKYVHKTVLGTIEGIINKNGEVGRFAKTSETVVIKSLFKTTFCIDEQTAIECGYKEKLSDGYFYPKDEYDRRFFIEKPYPSEEYKYSLPYSCDGLLTKVTKKYNELYTLPRRKSSFIENLYKSNKDLFDKYTFGLEFETIKGIIPQMICDRLGLIPLRDGSISGIEYATIPLSGLKGLYTISEVLNQILKRTEFDFSCSMHIHIGGMKRENETILSLFKTMFLIQNDIYEHFPMYKFKNMGVKRKNYTAPLSSKLMAKMNYNNPNKESIQEDMFKLVEYLTGGNYDFKQIKLENIKHHPNNPGNERKWGMRARYLWFNIIPIIFTNKKTVEFRIFGMPDKEIKLFSFLAMSLALVDFSVHNKQPILENPDVLDPYGLHRILQSVFGEYRSIDRYMYERRMHVRELTRGKGLNYTEKDIR